MILKFLSLINFKNHESLQIDFSPHVNCFLGNNGVGKTNLLDAIHYLSFCKSYYNVFESDNIKYEERFFMLKGDLVDNDGYTYKEGDFVSLSGGSRHYSHSPSGCTIVVTHRGKVIDLDKDEI